MSHDNSNDNVEFWFTLVCTIGLFFGIIADYTPLIPDQAAILFYIISYIGGGYQGVKETFIHLKRFEINIDFLMISAALGAAVLGQWVEGATLLFLFSVSGSLETYALDKSRNAIHSLLKLRPGQGLMRLPDGTEKLVPIEELNIGDIVIVRPGEYIPIDGTIIKGQTTIDQSAITGESIPVNKETGDFVYAATLNENGVIELEVTKEAKDTTVSKIISLVESAQKNKAKTQRFLDAFEPRYALSVVAIVTLMIFIPWLLLGHDFNSTFYRAMTILVVASPCALIISTPASIISAIANGAKSGILFKGGVHVEQTVEIDTIAFDKTGTLTSGTPSVTDLFYYNQSDNTFSSESEPLNYLIAISAGCEMYSEHHLAEAIIKKAKEMSVEPVVVSDMQATPGQGVRAKWNNKTVSVGNSRLFQDQMEQWDPTITQKADEIKSEGKTVVFVTEENLPIGIIALADTLRPQAKMAIQKLKSMGIKKIVMLTGDNLQVAKSIAEELDIDEVFADLLPEKKVEIIEQLKSTGTVAMIGDGVNDAPALATSHLGIAMGAAGTDVALETADIVLMGDDLAKLPYLLWLARKAKKVVWQNIIFSMAVIGVLLIGVFLIDLPLTIGVIGHEGSTLMVVLNGLRLLKKEDLANIK